VNGEATVESISVESMVESAVESMTAGWMEDCVWRLRWYIVWVDCRLGRGHSAG